MLITDIDEGLLFTSDNLFWGTIKLFSEVKNNFLVPKNKLSDVNKTYIDKGQKFKQLTCDLMAFFCIKQANYQKLVS
jgi:acid phosphatase class B